MKSKIFISVSIPEKFKKRLFRSVEKWRELPVKWVKQENLHITLKYLGFVDNDAIPEICQKVALAAQKSQIFDLAMDKIEFFPSPDEPKMIALTGPENENLRDLVNQIEESLDLSYAPKKTFRPHATLGRIRKMKWGALAEAPEINEKFSMNLSVESADIMASNFDSDGNVYSVIESCPLK